MRELIRHPRHHFWPDAISLLTAPEGEAPLVDTTQLLEAGPWPAAAPPCA